jgi:ribonuclease Z
MKISLTFLGTGAVVPTSTRNHTAILLKYKNEDILIDCGEGTQRQFRKARLNPCRLTKILITHWHGDHVLGLPGLFQTLALNGYKKTLEIYGPRGTKQYIKEILKTFVMTKKLKMNVHDVAGTFIKNSDFKISSFLLSNHPPTNGYLFEESDRIRIDKSKLKKLKLNREEQTKLSQLSQGKNIQINGKTINYKNLTYRQKGKKISFILDTKTCANAKKLAKDSDLAVIESTYANEESKIAYEYEHLTAGKAAEIARQAGAKQLILTHFSQRYENKEARLLKQAQKIFRNTRLAEDLMRVEV